MAMETDQRGLLEEEEEEEESSCKKQKITQVFVDKVNSTTHFQHTDYMDSSTSAVDERNKKGNCENPLTRVDWQNMKTYVRKLPLENEKEVFKGSSSKETSCLMANNDDGTKSYDECNTKEKISLTGIWRRKNGRYAAVIKDRIRRKKVWLGTFDAAEEASQAYFSKKSEFEKLSQGNKEDKLKKKCDQIRQPESPLIVASFSMANDQTFDTASGNGRDKRIDSHKSTTHLIGAHKSKAPGNYTSRITNPITKKKIWLGTFDTAEEASQAYFSKKSEFEKLSQGNKEDKVKKKCDQIQQPESPLIVASFSMANDQTFDTASGNGRDKRIDSHKSTTHLIGAHKSKAPGKYTSRIINPITKKRIWLGTFDTAKEASRAYHSKKLEFEKLVKANQQQCSSKQSHSKQDAGEEKLVTVKQGHENVNCHEPLPESAGGSKINVLITNSSDRGTDQRIDSHEIGTGEKAFCQKKQVFLGTVKEASKVFNPCLIANINGAESSDECNITTSCDPKAKRSFIGVQRRKSGRYAAVIADRIKRTKVWSGTFDTAEEASQAYFSKKSELEKLSQHGNKMNKPKKNSDQIQPDSPVVKTLNIASWGRTKKRTDSQGKIPGSSKETSCLMANVHGTKSSDMCNTTRSCDPKAKRSLIGIQRQKNRRYAAAITDRIRHKKVCLGTFDTIEEASRAYQSKKLKLQKLVKAKQNQCTNEQIPSKQDKKSAEVVNVKQGRNINCELKSAGGSGIDVPISNSSKGRAGQRIDSHEIGTAEEAFHAYLSKKFDSQSSKEVELKGNMPTDSSAGEKQVGQEDDKDLWMGEWVQLPGNRAVKFSLKLGLPIIDNYGSLLGEFSTLDDLSIC